jgi:hypothetical protein
MRIHCYIPGFKGSRVLGFKWFYCNLGILETCIPLSRQRERVGVRVDMISDDSPSLPLSGIPYSPIHAKRPALLF